MRDEVLTHWKPISGRWQLPNMQRIVAAPCWGAQHRTDGCGLEAIFFVGGLLQHSIF
jgi:hypothetical protein